MDRIKKEDVFNCLGNDQGIIRTKEQDGKLIFWEIGRIKVFPENVVSKYGKGPLCADEIADEITKAINHPNPEKNGIGKNAADDCASIIHKASCSIAVGQNILERGKTMNYEELNKEEILKALEISYIEELKSKIEELKSKLYHAETIDSIKEKIKRIDDELNCDDTMQPLSYARYEKLQKQKAIYRNMLKIKIEEEEKKKEEQIKKEDSKIEKKIQHMRVGVTEIIEHDYYIDIDTSNMTNKKEEALYQRISCDCEDVDDIISLLDAIDINYRKTEEKESKRIETGRY